MKDHSVLPLNSVLNKNNGYGSRERVSSSSTMITSASVAATAARTSTTLSLDDRIPTLLESLRTNIFIPERQYYHFGTLEMIKNCEYIMDIDCDEDHNIDLTWQQQLADSVCLCKYFSFVLRCRWFSWPFLCWFGFNLCSDICYHGREVAFVFANQVSSIVLYIVVTYLLFVFCCTIIILP